MSHSVPFFLPGLVKYIFCEQTLSNRTMCFLKIFVNDGRFEAHMEMHVGSVDEEEHEQGIAHMIEHVAFLGSKKREKLLGTGARSNAYTDFHHTVFHVHSPVTTQVAV
jgi:predicted Zn-dependent peptidase